MCVKRIPMASAIRTVADHNLERWRDEDAMEVGKGKSLKGRTSQKISWRNCNRSSPAFAPSDKSKWHLYVGKDADKYQNQSKAIFDRDSKAKANRHPRLPNKANRDLYAGAN